uniref:RING-type E3 ubiquitin transferase n=2 Tax=Galliformes TaxID=8976 RepID=A0A8V0X0H4_CHICK
MSGAAGSGVPHAGEPQRESGVPLELPAAAGEASGDPSAEGESGGSSGEAGAAADDKPETRSVCSSESGSGSHPGGAGPICKICFQGPEQVRRHPAARAPISTTDSARRRLPGPRCPVPPAGSAARRARPERGRSNRRPAAQRVRRHRGLSGVSCRALGAGRWGKPAVSRGWLMRRLSSGRHDRRKHFCTIHNFVLPFQGELLNPCRCDGSVRYTHQLCLLKWISERGSWTCELCCYRYHVIAIKMKKPCQWQSITITLVEKVQMVAVILGSLFLVASVTWLLWSAFSPYAVWQRKDILFQICYGMYGFMDLVCIGLIVHEGASVYRVFKRWRAVNLHWDVLNYDKATDIEESNRGESSAGRTLWLPLTAFRNRNLVHPTQLTSPRFQCGYVLLHLFNRMRPQEDSSEDNGSGEVVMRVTSV